MSFASGKHKVGHMARMFFPLVIIILGAVSGLSCVWAQDLDPQLQLFSISNIEVDEQASDAVKARTRGLQQAQHRGFAALIAKITRDGAPEQLADISDDAVQRLIFGLEIEDERTSSRRYQARVTVRFQPDSVSQFLTDLDIPHVRASGQPVIIAHGHRRGLNTYVWDQDPVVARAQAAQDIINRIRLYVFPEDRQSLRTQIAEDQIFALSPRVATKITRALGGKDTVVMTTRWSAVSGLDYAFIFPPGQHMGSGTLQADSEEAALAAAYQTVMDEIDRLWRSRLLITAGGESILPALVLARSIADYETTLRTLRSLSVITSLRIDTISAPLSEITLGFNGTEDQLRFTLAARGVTMAPYGAKYLLSLNGEGAQQ